MKKAADLIVERAGQLLTLVPRGNAGTAEDQLGLIPDGSLAIEGEKVVWAGPARELESYVALREGGKRLDAGGKVVVPGFIDSHTHLLFSGTREVEFELRIKGATYQQIASSGGGIKSTVENTRRASRENLESAAIRRLALSSLSAVVAVAVFGQVTEGRAIGVDRA